MLVRDKFEQWPPFNLTDPHTSPLHLFSQPGGEFSNGRGVNYHVDPVSIGFWYRGKPFQKNIIGTVQARPRLFFFWEFT